MLKRYLLDTCIWRDFYEERFGPGGRPLGELAAKLIMKIIKKKDIILFNDKIISELRKDYSLDEINSMLNLLFLTGTVKKVRISDAALALCFEIAEERGIPSGDALNAIVAGEEDAIMVSQDKHYQLLTDFCVVKKPEQVI